VLSSVPSRAPRQGIPRSLAPSTLSRVAGVVAWIVLLGPLLTLAVHLQPSELVRALSTPDAFGPAVTSLVASALALAAVVVLGTPVAVVIARGPSRLARILETGVLAVLLLPPLVIGLLLVFMVGPLTPLGHLLATLHLSATNTLAALVIAELYEAAPYYVIAAAAAFAAADPDLEEQARLLGEGPWGAWRRAVLPQVAGELAGALSVAWARAVGAFGAVIIVAYHPYGLPLQLWTTLNELGLAQALPFALVLLVVALPFPLLAYARSRHARR